jgi:hypothetical protein
MISTMATVTSSFFWNMPVKKIISVLFNILLELAVCKMRREQIKDYRLPSFLGTL